jgi:hypothetical protein
VSDNKQSNTTGQIRRARNASTYAFAIMTAVAIGCVILWDSGHLTPAVYGFILALWIFAGLVAVGLWCTVYLCEWDARRAEQIGEKVDQLSEVVMVAEWWSAMEEDRDYVRRSSGN